jgi:hypothetical protein
MPNVILQIWNEIKQDYTFLLGLIAFLGQVYGFTKLFDSSLTTTEVYAWCAMLFLLMAFLSVRYIYKAKRVSPHARKQRRIYRLLGVAFIVLAIVALLPAGYRWRYLHTSWTPTDEAPPEIEPGFTIKQVRAEIPSEKAQLPLEVDMYLNSSRSSLQCSKGRNHEPITDQTFQVAKCVEYNILGSRLTQIFQGHNIGEHDPRLSEFNRKYSVDMIEPAFQALKKIAEYRNKHEPLLDLGPTIIILFVQNPDWKTKLLKEKLLPNADEWTRLTAEYPMLAKGLRKYLIEWVGLLDPIFHVSFRNNTKMPMEVIRVNYTAAFRRVGPQAEVIGAYVPPRYLLNLEEGTHQEELQPPILIPANTVKEIDLLLRLKQPEPGATVDISLDFLSLNPKYHAAVPGFAVTFWRGTSQ